MNTFPKSEKLCGKIRIATLYKEGRKFVSYPLRVSYKVVPDSEAEPQVLIWAPKALFKHAVDRNRCRRLMREAYRLNCQPLRDWCDAEHCSLQIAFNYMDREIQSQDAIAHAIRKAIRRITTPQEDKTPHAEQE